MLDNHNSHAKCFWMARDQLMQDNVHDLKLKLIAGREKDGRIYNVPTVSKVVVLITRNDETNSTRDIIVQKQNGNLQRINELHTSYLASKYPILFPYGEDGYRHDILHRPTLCSRLKSYCNYLEKALETFHNYHTEQEIFQIMLAID